MPGWFKLGEPLDPSWRGKPPQMLNDDIPTWWEYLDNPACPKYERLWYNVALTSVEPETIKALPAMQAMWLYNISKRIDVVGETKREAHIIEVTGRAGVRSLGQAVTYDILYDYIQPLPLRGDPRIVCQYADPDVIFAAQKLGVVIIELNPINIQTNISQAIQAP